MKSILAILSLVISSHALAAAVSPNLTAEYDTRGKRVVLKWQHTDPGVTAFVLQRSDDNNSWRDIYILGSEKFNPKNVEKFYDIYPAPTKNYYRLKVYTGINKFEYSASIMVIIGNPLSSWIIFPVPVRDVLNLQYNGSEPIRGVVSVFIQNMTGYVNIKRRFSSLSRNIQIPVDNLGKGVYDIRVLINDQVVWNQRFIK